MKIKKILLSLLAMITIISCQNDDQELQEIEQIEVNSKALRALKPANKVNVCLYKSWPVTFIAGPYSGCELYEKMNEKREELSKLIDSNGCPIYKIPPIIYFQCFSMNDSFYVEHWEKLIKDCGDGIPCEGEETNQIDLSPADAEEENPFGSGVYIRYK